MLETRCAVCQLSDGLVVDIIIAHPSEQAQIGCQLIEVMNGQACDIGYFWNGVDFSPPEPAISEGLV